MDLNELLQREGVTYTKEKGEHVFMQGELDSSIYYIQSGLLKAYYISEQGKESVKSFIVADDLIGSLSAAYSGSACSFNLLCLEKTIIVSISINRILEYANNDLELANNLIESLLKFSIKKENREYEFLSLSAEERFIKLLNTKPDLMTKVTQNDLARYLGITPVGLSRIKKRVFGHLE